MALWLDAELTVVAAIAPETELAADIPAGDVMESSYVRTRAEEFPPRSVLRTTQEVLGEPANAIAHFLNRQRDVLLAIVTRRRPARSNGDDLGSITAGCLAVQYPIINHLPWGSPKGLGHINNKPFSTTTSPFSTTIYSSINFTTPDCPQSNELCAGQYTLQFHGHNLRASIVRGELALPTTRAGH